MLDDVLRRNLPSVFEDDNGVHGLPPYLVRNPDHCALRYCPMLGNRVLHLCGINILATGDSQHLAARPPDVSLLTFSPLSTWYSGVKIIAIGDSSVIP